MPTINRHSTWFVLLVALFVTSLLVSNIIAVKLVLVAGLLMPAGVIVFPLSYILSDVLTEVYGYSLARKVIWLGFLCNLLAVAAISVAELLPAAPFWEGQEAFELILGASPRLLLSSFAAYLAGEFTNAYILARLKVATEGRFLWLRTIGSTLVGQGLDSAVFVTLAFIGLLPGPAIATAILTQWLIKSAYEALATPLTYGAVGFLKRIEGCDTFDRNVRFNPFALGGPGSSS